MGFFEKKDKKAEESGDQTAVLAPEAQDGADSPDDAAIEEGAVDVLSGKAKAMELIDLESEVLEEQDDDSADMDEIMRKYDRESNTRIWVGKPKIVVSIVLAAFSVYCIGMTLFSTALPETRLALFLGMVSVLGYALYPIKKKNVRPNYIPWYDIIIAIVTAAGFFYFAFNADVIIHLRAKLFEPYMIVLAVLSVLGLMELCRRCVGIPILVVVACLLVYVFYWTFSYDVDLWKGVRDVVRNLFYSRSGIFGTPTNVCYSFIVIFIIFGAFLERTGIAEFFIAFANRLAGWSSGGAAKVAVISSALCGMVSGSSVGNTVTTGSVTIPMMKKTGYKPEFAGAVEAASSTGGQIMPPIMGAAAFLMAEYMQIPYIEVAAKAIIPAFLYFAGIFITVHLEAKKLGLKGMDRKDLPKWSYLGKNCYLIIPLVMLVYLVASGARTMAYSAAISIIGAFVVGFINFTVMGVQNREAGETVGSVMVNSLKIAGKAGFDALQAGARNCIAVAVACAMAGMIAGCFTITGLAQTVINSIVTMAESSVFIPPMMVGLVLTMITCIILGMGVPTTANYCIMAATTAPILIALDVPQVAAHFFVFYFGIVADITPPVALAAYAGSAIAKSNPMKTGLNAARIAIAAFIVPYILAYNPVMILEGDFMWLQVAQIVATSLIGLFGLATALNGNLFCKINVLFRILLAVGGLCMVVPETVTDIVGIAVIAAIVVFQYFLSKRKTAPAAPAAA